jgi:membrane protease YdiL (CAAX protease family)
MTSRKTSRTFFSERVWPIVRVLAVQLFLMVGIVGNLAGWLLLALLVDRLHWLQIDFHGKTLNTISPDGKVIGFIILFSVNLLIVLLAWRWLERKRPQDMLWRFGRREWRPLVWGLLAGLTEVLLVFGGLVLLGVARPVWGLAAVPLKTILVAIGWILASSVLGPIVEEAMNRGYWFQNIQRGWGVVAATVVTSILFGALHLLNPNAELLGAINIALGAIAWVLGLLYFRSLWFPIGWHAAWNFAQFFIAGLPNSGIAVKSMGLSGTTLFVTELSGPRWLTGGDFGMEASLVETIVLIGAIAFMFMLKRRLPNSVEELV